MVTSTPLIFSLLGEYSMPELHGSLQFLSSFDLHLKQSTAYVNGSFSKSSGERCQLIWTTVALTTVALAVSGAFGNSTSKQNMFNCKHVHSHVQNNCTPQFYTKTTLCISFEYDKGNGSQRLNELLPDSFAAFSDKRGLQIL